MTVFTECETLKNLKVLWVGLERAGPNACLCVECTSLALIQCHLVVPIYVLQCNVPLIQEQSRLLSATAEHSYSKIPPLIVLPANKRCPSTVLCIQRERLDQLLNCMCPSHIHYPSPYPCVVNISISITYPSISMSPAQISCPRTRCPPTIQLEYKVKLERKSLQCTNYPNVHFY